jgi:hypothetical protein
MPDTAQYIERLVPLVVGSRARKRLRMSVGGVLQRLAAEFGGAPTRIELARTGEALHVTPDGRVFLNARQVRALGGMRRAGHKTRVRFYYGLRKIIIDWFFQGDNASGGNGEMASVCGTSGLGLLIRAEKCTRKAGDQTWRLKGICRRLRKPLGDWLDWMVTNHALEEGVWGEAQAACEPGASQRTKWLIQFVSKDRGGREDSEDAGGDVLFHTAAFTTFRTEFQTGLDRIPDGTWTVRAR